MMREGDADSVNGLENVQVDIVMMRIPDGHWRLKLKKFSQSETRRDRTGDRTAERAEPPKRDAYRRQGR
jgi:hypothetical protein